MVNNKTLAATILSSDYGVLRHVADNYRTWLTEPTMVVLREAMADAQDRLLREIMWSNTTFKCFISEAVPAVEEVKDEEGNIITEAVEAVPEMIYTHVSEVSIPKHLDPAVYIEDVDPKDYNAFMDAMEEGFDGMYTAGLGDAYNIMYRVGMLRAGDDYNFRPDDLFSHKEILEGLKTFADNEGIVPDTDEYIETLQYANLTVLAMCAAHHDNRHDILTAMLEEQFDVESEDTVHEATLDDANTDPVATINDAAEAVNSDEEPGCITGIPA